MASNICYENLWWTFSSSIYIEYLLNNAVSYLPLPPAYSCALQAIAEIVKYLTSTVLRN